MTETIVLNDWDLEQIEKRGFVKYGRFIISKVKEIEE